MAIRPKRKDAEPEPIQALEAEVAALRRELRTLNGHRFVRIHNSVPRLLSFQFVRGLAFGFGTVIGGGLLLSAVAWSLAQIDFIPIIGEWASQIAAELGAIPENGN